LRKFGQRVRLERKPWQLLISLLERPGELVTRAELQRAVWSADVFVDFEHGLNVAVRKLRAALNDSVENPKYIETVASEGYRFIGIVEQASSIVSTSSLAETLPQTDPVPVCASDHPSAATLQNQESQCPNDVSLQPPQTRWTRWGAIALATSVVLVMITAMRSSWRASRGASRTHPDKVMIVVLPFENFTGDPDQEYLSDGMTEELSERLGNLNPRQIGVIGRTSAMTYKHSARTISQIGKELAVDYVLEGSVRHKGNKLRVTAQLVRVSDQTHLWAQDYDGDVRDILQVEDEVANEIANQVGASMAMGGPVRSIHAHVPKPEAHEDYLLARYYWNKRTPAGWSNGAEYFRRAINKDPEYAAAYAGLAECRIPKEEALAAARKSIELDPQSGEARMALGWVELYRELNLAAAEDALRSAVGLAPNYAPAYHTYSGVLELTGRLQDAINQERHAVLLDPLSLISRASLAEALSIAGQNDTAIQEIKRIFAMDPRFPKAHETLGLIYMRTGMYKEAIDEYQTIEQYGGEKPLGSLGYAYARSGNKDEALRILSELHDLERRSPSGSISYDLATVEMGLGDQDKALANLDNAYHQHDDDGLLWLKIDPIFDPLRSDPSFQDLLRRMKLIT
jgi:TolB-like protein/tetratricopeptide (TPR) repeat protein/DNA-binding winged helix-turn-helix (wHTH) protein